MKKTYYYSSSSGNCSQSTQSSVSTIIRTRTVNGCTTTTREVITNGESAAVPAISQAPQVIASSTEIPISSGASSFEALCLEEHNKYRRIHGSPPLTLDPGMCRYAEQWAQNIASRNQMQHRSNNKYGENIFWASGSTVSGKDPVKSWYDEIRNYAFGRGGFSSNTGHFTQVVWKSSQKLGVGVVKRGNSTWVVANYDPPGNFAGKYQENVSPPQR